MDALPFRFLKRKIQHWSMKITWNLFQNYVRKLSPKIGPILVPKTKVCIHQKIVKLGIDKRKKKGNNLNLGFFSLSIYICNFYLFILKLKDLFYIKNLPYLEPKVSLKCIIYHWGFQAHFPFKNLRCLFLLKCTHLIYLKNNHLMNFPFFFKFMKSTHLD